MPTFKQHEDNAILGENLIVHLKEDYCHDLLISLLSIDTGEIIENELSKLSIHELKEIYEKCNK